MLLTVCTIATSIDVERVFSRGRLVLSHVRNRLSVDSTRALLCLGAWSHMNIIKQNDIINVTKMDDAEKDGEDIEDETLSFAAYIDTVL